MKLNTGASVPAIGLGTWACRNDECYETVKCALKLGYRHIDTAYAYENEEPIGRAIRDSGIPREELFITTKVPSVWLDNPLESLNKSLDKLGLEYVDLLLMHWPVMMVTNGGPNYWRPVRPDGKRNVNHDFDCAEGWRLFEQLPKSKVRAIGVSNFDSVQLDHIIKNSNTVPAMNQVELHPYLPQNKLLDYCNKHGILLTAFSPMGQKTIPLRDEAIIKEVAAKNGITPAQCLLSWATTRNTFAIPKSSNPDRLEQNLQIIELSPEDMARIATMTAHTFKRLNRPDYDGIPMFQDDDPDRTEYLVMVE